MLAGRLHVIERALRMESVAPPHRRAARSTGAQDEFGGPLRLVDLHKMARIR